MDYLTSERNRLVAEIDALEAELDAQDMPDPATLRRMADLSEDLTRLESDVTGAPRHSDLIDGVRSGRYRLEAGAPNGDDYQTQRTHSAAMRVLDQAVNTDRFSARGAELVENLCTTGTPLEQTWAQQYVQAAGSEDYELAFAKLLVSPERGHLEWTEPEAAAFRQVKTLQRAMSTSSTHGAEMIPLTLDPTILITSDGNTNPLRAISRVVQTMTDSWQGVTSAGVTVEWLAEATEAADASPTLAGPSIPVFKGSAFVPFSYEVAQDAVGFMQELGKLLADGYDQLTATAYTTGAGTTEPTGIITSLVASAGTTAQITPATPETFASADVYSVQNALPPRFQPNASWNAALGVLNLARQLETTNGALKFPELAANPPRLLGRPVYENSNMDGSFDAAATANNYLLLYGDFSNFVIVDRFPSQVELIPNLVGANRRPTGQRGAFLWARTGSDVVASQAFRLLNIATTA